MDKNRGQYLTRSLTVKKIMKNLIKNRSGEAFEPCAGEGDLVEILEEFDYNTINAIEIDSQMISRKKCLTDIQCVDFFHYIESGQTYNTILGNPPYVKIKNTEEQVKKRLKKLKHYPMNGNLYYYFIEKSILSLNPGGELIFIVPKEWLYNDTAKRLRKMMFNHGSITDFIDCGSEKVFDDANLISLCIFRFEQGCYDRTLNFFDSMEDFLDNNYYEKELIHYQDQFGIFTKELCTKICLAQPIKYYFDVKVGSIVTGMDKVFKIRKDMDIESECITSVLMTTKKEEQFIDVDKLDIDQIPEKTKSYLLKHKEALIDRKIMNFDESNWWKYGAIRNYDMATSNRDRIFALCKTRHKEIFWKGKSRQLYGAGILALFPNMLVDRPINIDIIADMLNSKFYREIYKSFFLTVGNKITFTARVLENLPLLYI